MIIIRDKKKSAGKMPRFLFDPGNTSLVIGGCGNQFPPYPSSMRFRPGKRFYSPKKRNADKRAVCVIAYF